MRKTIWAMALFVGMTLAAGAANAGVIAVLDVKAAMAAHPKTTTALKELDQFRKTQFAAASKALDEEVKKKLGKRQPEDLDEDEQRELMRIRNEYESGFERDVSKKDLQLTDPILQDIRDVVGQLSREKGFEVVVDRESVFYPVGGPTDITDLVISRLKGE